MLAYYNERAPEYEEAYTLGTGTASITEPDQIVRGRIVDLACGTAFWLPHYAQHCRHMTLFDQSDNMLAEAREKATRLVERRAREIQREGRASGPAAERRHDVRHLQTVLRPG